MHTTRIVATLGVVATCLSSIASAEVIYQSGSLGETGTPWLGPAPATNVNPDVFVGARFEIDQPVQTSSIGGHFVGHPLNPSDEFFGALIQLKNDADFPDSDDLSSVDVLGVTTLTFPGTSDEVFGELTVTLEPGWYAVVFGSGLFGTTAVGATLRNGMDDGPQAYIGWQPGEGWLELSSFFENHYFVVEGTVIPEPTTIVLLGTCGALLLLVRRNRSRLSA